MSNKPTHDPHVRALANDLNKVIDRYALEFDLTLDAVIGTLEIIKLDLYMSETHEYYDE